MRAGSISARTYIQRLAARPVVLLRGSTEYTLRTTDRLSILPVHRANARYAGGSVGPQLRTRVLLRSIRARRFMGSRRSLGDSITITLDDAPLGCSQRLPADGMEAWCRRAREDRGKGSASSYRPRPTTSWRKVKPRHEGHFVIGGVALTRSGYAGLPVGTPATSGTMPASTGEWTGRSLPSAPATAGRCQCRRFSDLGRRGGVTCLEPRVAVEVFYAEIVNGGLRAPVSRTFLR